MLSRTARSLASVVRNVDRLASGDGDGSRSDRRPSFLGASFVEAATEEDEAIDREVSERSSIPSSLANKRGETFGIGGSSCGLSPPRAASIGSSSSIVGVLLPFSAARLAPRSGLIGGLRRARAVAGVGVLKPLTASPPVDGTDDAAADDRSRDPSRRREKALRMLDLRAGGSGGVDSRWPALLGMDQSAVAEPLSSARAAEGKAGREVDTRPTAS